MKTRRRIHVLSAFRPYLYALQAFNVESFRDKPISLKIRLVCCALLVSMVVAAAPFVIFLGIWYMIENSLDVREFSTSIAIMLAFAQIVVTAVSIIRKNKLIGRTVDAIQMLVDERKIAFTNIIMENAKIHVFLDNFYWIETESSVESFIIYKRIEAIHTLITRIMFNTFSLVVAIMFILATMFPISFTMFEYPEPSQWRRLLEIQ